MFQWLTKYIKRIGVYGVELELREPSTEAAISSANPTPGLPEWAGEYIRTQHEYVLLLESIKTKDQWMDEEPRLTRLARESAEYTKKFLSLPAGQMCLFDDHYPNRLDPLWARLEAAMSRLEKLGVVNDDWRR